MSITSSKSKKAAASVTNCSGAKSKHLCDDIICKRCDYVPVSGGLMQSTCFMTIIYDCVIRQAAFAAAIELHESMDYKR